MSCLQSEIRIDNSTIEKMFMDSELVMENVTLFWETEIPCKLTLEWAPKTYPIHFEEFKRKITDLTHLSINKRKNDPIYVFANKVVKKKNTLIEKGLPIICSYLPPNAHFETTIYLTSFIFLSGPDTSEPKYAPNAFVREPDIVVNLSSKFWIHDENQLLNEMIHEIYHIGFADRLGKFRPNPDIKSNEELQKNILWLLYFEGLATYVGYKALSIFPAPVTELGKSAGSYDYKMLDDITDVKRSIDIINELFSKMNTLPYDKAEELVRKKGVMERAVYVAGAYMAKIIEKKNNKNVLIDSLMKGPIQFMETYNEKTDEMKLNY